MKTLALNAVAIIFVLSSCSSHKSFTHQRYTSLGHSKHTTVTDKKEGYASVRKNNTPAAEPVMVNVVPAAAEQVAVSEAHNPEILTASAEKSAPVLKHKTVALASASAETASLKNSNSANTFKSFTKQIKTEKQHKRGLLFGVIDALLSIILIVVVVAVVVFLILILI